MALGACVVASQGGEWTEAMRVLRRLRDEGLVVDDADYLGVALTVCNNEEAMLALLMQMRSESNLVLAKCLPISALSPHLCASHHLQHVPLSLSVSRSLLLFPLPPPSFCLHPSSTLSLSLLPLPSFSLPFPALYFPDIVRSGMSLSPMRHNPSDGEAVVEVDGEGREGTGRGKGGDGTGRRKEQGM